MSYTLHVWRQIRRGTRTAGSFGVRRVALYFQLVLAPAPESDCEEEGEREQERRREKSQRGDRVGQWAELHV